MKAKAGITTIRRRKALMLAATMSLLLLPAADSQKPSDLTVHVHVTCVGKYNLHKTEGKDRFDETDEITIEYEATSHTTAPPGTPPWQMSTETTNYHFTVSGSGTGSADDITLSWTWKLVNATTDLRGLMKDLGPGSFEVAVPDFQNDAKVEPQVQLQSAGQSKDWLEADAKKAVAQMAIHPLADGAATMFDTPLSKQDYDAMGQFYDQLKGTFDQNAKSFSKSGSASRTSSNPLGMTSSINVDYSLNFNQQPEDVEAILIPQNGYERWMPQAGHDEDTPGNGLMVNVVLQKKDKPGEKPNAKAKSFKFELVGVSKEPGVCLNWPPKEKTKQSPDFDLKIDQDANPGLQVAPDGQSATTTGDLQQSSVIVFSYDWGGWGSLKVTADLGNQTVTAHLQNKPNVAELKIPKDDNGNHVADTWELSGELKDADVDLDTNPIGDHTGDALSYYEEYRGFMVQGEHERTDPNRKDVFIYDMNHLGLGYFPLSGMSTHVLRKDEYTWVPPSDPRQNGRVVNFNHGFAHLGDEHVLLLVNGPAPDAPGVLGEAVGGPGPPKMITGVYVDKAACLGSWWGDLEVQSHLGHELAHGCNVPHHGDGDYSPDDFWMKGQDGKWYPIGTPSKQEVSVRQGEHSGAMQCIMRHYRSGYYEAGYGKYRWRKPGEKVWTQGEEYGIAEIPGDMFCTGPDGAPPNKRLGPAAPGRGDCSEKFCVNDLKH